LSPAYGNDLPANDEEIAMDDSILMTHQRRSFVGVLPETLEEAEELATSIEQAVQRETGHGVADLTVEVSPHGILLRGRCMTYYTKQLAQHAAMNIPGGDRLTNSIEVS
jgi:aromatic ring-opening dioxygenase LigB subunit